MELVHPDDVSRMATLGVAVDLQLTQWNQPAALHDLDELIGKPRVDGRAWRLRDLHEGGVTVALSSDYDVGPLSPFQGMEYALTRGDQSLPDVASAVRAYTIAGAQIMRSEDRTGSLVVGKRADLVVVDQDIFTVDVTAIGATRVLWTVLDGAEVYRAPGFSL